MSTWYKVIFSHPTNKDVSVTRFVDKKPSIRKLREMARAAEESVLLRDWPKTTDDWVPSMEEVEGPDV